MTDNKVVVNEANKCCICQDALFKDAFDSLTIHKDKKNKHWDHTFHEKCINEWCQHCYKTNKAPNCPLCPDYKISKKHLPQRKDDEEESQPVFESPQQELAIRRLHGIPYSHNTYQDYYDQRGCPIFLGIMVCIDNVCILKYSNRSLNLDLNSTVYALRHTILSKSKVVYKSARGRKSNISHNLDFNNWILWNTIKTFDRNKLIQYYESQDYLKNRRNELK